jgi:hypothetical protein
MLYSLGAIERVCLGLFGNTEDSDYWLNTGSWLSGKSVYAEFSGGILDTPRLSKEIRLESTHVVQLLESRR